MLVLIPRVWEVNVKWTDDTNCMANKIESGIPLLCILKEVIGSNLLFLRGYLLLGGVDLLIIIIGLLEPFGVFVTGFLNIRHSKFCCHILNHFLFQGRARAVQATHLISKQVFPLFPWLIFFILSLLLTCESTKGALRLLFLRWRTDVLTPPKVPANEPSLWTWGVEKPWDSCSAAVDRKHDGATETRQEAGMTKL